MRRVSLLLVWYFGLLSGTLLSADVVTLKDGRRISGLVESGNTQELHVKVADQPQTIDVHEIQTIQFGVSTPAQPAKAPPPRAAGSGSAKPEPATAQPNSLILNDGSPVAGRWWSIDATTVHFLVNNQLQEYSRREVSGITFGSATLPSSPEPSTTPPAPAPSAPHAAQPAQPPGPPPSSARPAPQPQPRTSGSAPPSSPRGRAQPQEIGVVYSWDGTTLTPLEPNQAVEHGGVSAQYWEMPGPRSSVRLKEAPSLVFVVYLRGDTDPASYSLFVLQTVDGGRRTRSEPGRRGSLMTWPVDVKKKGGSSVITYALVVRDLPTGEYSFSPSTSNVGYCFGVDPSPAGQ